MYPIARPIRYELEKRFVIMGDLVIEVLSNSIEYLYHVIPEEYIVSEYMREPFFTLILYYTPQIGEEYTVYLPPTEEQMKNSYQPNSLYLNDDYKFEENEYPNKTIHFSCGEQLSVVISGNRDVFVFYIKRYIKKAASSYYKKRGYFIVHAGSIIKDDKIYVVVGQSHSGKSTFCFNLGNNGFELLNDDILFVKYNGEEIVAKSIQMNSCIRKKAIPYIVDSKSHLDLKRDYYSEYNETYYVKKKCIEVGDVVIGAVFFIDRKKEGNKDLENGINSIPFPLNDKEFVETMSQFDQDLLSERSGLRDVFAKLPSYSIALDGDVGRIMEEFRRVISDI